MAKKKTWNEKLSDSKDLPKVIEIHGRMSKRWGEGTCAIPSPLEVNELMRKVQKGKLTTIQELRERIAKNHDATVGCPITTGIFAWIAANAANESAENGAKKFTPYWRTLKAGGELNPKYPGGVHNLRKLLEAEGHKVIAKGKKFVVADYERSLCKFKD